MTVALDAVMMVCRRGQGFDRELVLGEVMCHGLGVGWLFRGWVLLLARR